MNVSTYKKKYLGERVFYQNETMLLGMMPGYKKSSDTWVQIFKSSNSDIIYIRLNQFEEKLDNGDIVILFNELENSQRNFLLQLNSREITPVNNMLFDSTCKNLVKSVCNRDGYLNSEKKLLNSILDAFQKKEFIVHGKE